MPESSSRPAAMRSLAMSRQVLVVLGQATAVAGLTDGAVAVRLGISREHFNRAKNGHVPLTSDQLFGWAALVGVVISGSQYGDGPGAAA